MVRSVDSTVLHKQSQRVESSMLCHVPAKSVESVGSIRRNSKKRDRIYAISRPLLVLGWSMNNQRPTDGITHADRLLCL